MESPLTRLMHILLLLSLFAAGNSQNATDSRSKKSLSVFTVVKFPNTVCESSTSGRNGTCYTQSECTAKGGSSSGACASSFGVCCVFEATCGSATLSENNTYFTSSGITKGSSCKLEVCKCHSNVCQLRLDFETFILNLPITATTGVNGNAAANAGSYTLQGTCHVDTFGVSSPGSTTIPTICGTNTGEHMYVPASDQCNVLSANIGSTSSATTGSFTIKITQIPCNSPVLPPRGCLQYYYGSEVGAVQSFNFQRTGTGSSGVGTAGSSQLLVNQHYNACIRTERTYCTICYWNAIADTSGFHMSVPNGIAAIGLLGWDTNCGNLGNGIIIAAGINGLGYVNGGHYDYVNIPGGNCQPTASGTASTGQPVDRYCGTALRCADSDKTIAGAPTNTVCSSLKPFKIGVHSDGTEAAWPAAAIAENRGNNNLGFNLNYWMQTSCMHHDGAI